MSALPFAKIYRKIYDGPLGKDPMRRAIFMDMCVLADAQGRVELDYPYIAAVTGWPAEILVDKLAELTRPEPASGNQRQEGAPLRLLNPDRPYGWQIVNYAYYRNLRLRNNERRLAYRREWMREKRKEKREQREPPREQREPQNVNTVNHCSGSQVFTREQTVNKPVFTPCSRPVHAPERHTVNALEPNDLQKQREQPVNRREHLREQSVNPEEIEKRDIKKSSAQKRNGVIDSEWVARIANDSAYSGINVSREFGKMANWCKVNHLAPTRALFVNWLNRIEVTDTGEGLDAEPGEDETPEWTSERVSATRKLFPGVSEDLFLKSYVLVAGDVRAQIEMQVKKMGAKNGSSS